MVKRCAVASCKNGTHNSPDLSYFSFPSDGKQRLKWKKFCRRGDQNVLDLCDPRICADHFNISDIKTSVTGKKFLKPGSVPKVFTPFICRDVPKSSEREQRKLRRESANDEDDRLDKENKKDVQTKYRRLNHPSPFAMNTAENCCHVLPSPELIFRDHAYFSNSDKENGIAKEEDTFCTLPKKGCTSTRTSCASTQTDISIFSIENELAELRKECQFLKAKLDDKKLLKRELFTEDILCNDESVKFYTGLPSISCFLGTLKVIQPYAERIKYWDKKKDSKSYYQNDVTKKKPGRKRQLSVKEEYLLTLCRLRLGLLNKHLADLFGISEASISITVTTWICLLDKLFKDTLLRWPSREEIQRSYPKSFKCYPNTRVVIDAT